MVGWIQLLGEQYCLAVIVCSSTCSGFPGLGPRAPYPVSRYTTIFCLSAITPTTTTMRKKMRTKMARTATPPILLVDLGVLSDKSPLKSAFYTDKTQTREFGYAQALLIHYHNAQAANRTIPLSHVHRRDFRR
ncbi:hypothetical protein X777_08100 [Ooceraea biroi]|uniref:Uncharacterized protein n=1 Tax=Ooceraea biroi TaxID=2015173 RepID=A0A026W968_OOCBI|nr:hypothetical protein X777_08100 [Ooceraea biroi]